MRSALGPKARGPGHEQLLVLSVRETGATGRGEAPNGRMIWETLLGALRVLPSLTPEFSGPPCCWGEIEAPINALLQ